MTIQGETGGDHETRFRHSRDITMIKHPLRNKASDAEKRRV